MPRNEFARVPPPTSIGPYRVVRELGRGGMGHVYECVHVQLRKRVAIKILREHLLDDQVVVQRFLREGRAVCHIDHPHVVAVHELGSDAEAPYLVMELLEGLHLGDKLRNSGPLPLPELAEIMLPVLSAVSAAHAAGVVHRDLKPSNIMLSRARDGQIVPKVLDFGTSKVDVDDGEQLLTITGAVLGTIHYMSPEQTRAPRDVDAKSDQYSLGLILYECATGKKPFSAESSYELMHAIMTAPVEAPSALNPALPKAFDEIVLRAMNRLPRERYASVRALAAALLPFASSAVLEAWSAEFATNALDESDALRQSVAANDDNLEQNGRRSSNPTASTLFDRMSQPFRPRRWLGALVLVALLLGLVLAALRANESRPAGKLANTSDAPSASSPAAAPQPTPANPKSGGDPRQTSPGTQVAAPPASSEHEDAREAATPAASEAAAGPVPASQAPASPGPKPSLGKRAHVKPGSLPRRVPLGDNGAPILE